MSSARTIVLVFGGFAVINLAAPCGAQGWPAKPVRILVGFTPGTTTDIIARTVAVKLTESFGQQVVVENVAGTSGNLAGAAAARATPDGHTLLLGGTSLTVGPFLYRKLPFDARRDLLPVGLIATVPNVIVVHPALPARNLKQLIALARAQPGKLDYSSSGKGSAGHLSMELLKNMAGIDITEVQYKSSAQALSDVIGGQVAINYPSLSAALPQIRANRVRALAVSGTRRSAGAPEIPAVAETGGTLAAYDANGTYGLYAPTGTPRDVVLGINAALARAMQASDVRERLASQGAEMAGGTPDAFAAHLQAAGERWGRLIRQLGLQLD